MFWRGLTDRPLFKPISQLHQIVRKIGKLQQTENNNNHLAIIVQAESCYDW